MGKKIQRNNVFVAIPLQRQRTPRERETMDGTKPAERQN